MRGVARDEAGQWEEKCSSALEWRWWIAVKSDAVVAGWVIAVFGEGEAAEAVVAGVVFVGGALEGVAVGVGLVTGGLAFFVGGEQAGGVEARPRVCLHAFGMTLRARALGRRIDHDPA
jgi:hypothetical protein